MILELNRDERARGIYNDRVKSPIEILLNKALLKMMFANFKGELEKERSDSPRSTIKTEKPTDFPKR